MHPAFIVVAFVGFSVSGGGLRMRWTYRTAVSEEFRGWANAGSWMWKAGAIIFIVGLIGVALT